ncbi:MAG: Na/Pi cotransporter family protein [Eubacteriales bacterium]|nr:Na/Pi cotransporter family protein [Eubacteriales bacterium]
MIVKMSMGVIGGLGLFILGMHMMSEGLHKVAGDKLRRFLELLTFNRFIAVLTGFVITAAIQSSSATTVMVVGFVNAGLMTLTQAVGTILGANIGTTVTGQIISFDIAGFALPAIAFGVVLYVFVNKRMYKNIGESILGFGILFLGISIMGDALDGIKEFPQVINLLGQFGQHPILGLLAGMLFTSLVQSSSATTAVVITLVGQGVLDLNGAMSLVLGSNIGTCITAMLASIGTGLNARRTAVAHLLFNVFGVLFFMLILKPYTIFIQGLSTAIPRQVAWGHTLFNVTNTLLFLPFLNQFVKLITKIVPGTEEIFETGPIYLDKNLLNSPSLALGATEREISRMADLSVEMFDNSMSMLLQTDINLIKNIHRNEEVVDELEQQITIYLADLAQHGLSEEQSRLLAGYMHAVNDIERIGDHSENISDLVREKIEDKYPFSESATEELKDMYAKVRNMTAKAIAAFRARNKTLAREILVDDNEIDRLEKKLRQRHVARINEGRCFPPSGVIFLDIIANFERIGDHATNIAQTVLGDY